MRRGLGRLVDVTDYGNTSMRHSESWLRPVKVWIPTESKLQLKVWKCSDRDPTMWRSVSSANRKGRIAAATHEHLKIPERFVNTAAADEDASVGPVTVAPSAHAHKLEFRSNYPEKTAVWETVSVEGLQTSPETKTSSHLLCNKQL